MKILMYGWEFPPNISGGLGVACYGIVQGLLDLHIDCTLVLPDLGNELIDIGAQLTVIKTKAHAGGLTLQPIDSMLRPYQTEESYHTLYEHAAQKKIYGDNLWAEIHRYADIASQAAVTEKHDLIHAHDWLTILAGIKAKAISGKPLIFHVHALEIDRSGTNLCQAVFDIEKFGMQQADAIIAVSQFSKEIIIKHYGIAAEKITVVHNGITQEKTLPIANSHRANAPRAIVLFLGRVTQQKGPFYFIEAAIHILNKRQDIDFVIAGEGDQLAQMIEKVAAAGISDHVHFTGFLEPKEVKNLYQISDVYVMPSVSEPFGIACLEALSHHLPVIISKQSGVAEVLNHSLKIDYWNIEALAEKIMALIDFPALRNEMLAHNQKELAHLSWCAAAEKILSVYQKLIS